MGFGDNEPPAVRMDPFPATLSGPGGFKLLFLTFVSWDVIKYHVTGGGVDQRVRVDGTRYSTEAVYTPTRSNVTYCITAQGCSHSDYCSPESRPLCTVSATNTNSLRTFLHISGIATNTLILLRPLLRSADRSGPLRAVMGLI